MDWKAEFDTILEEVLKLERAWMSWRAEKSEGLDFSVEKTFDYSFRLARMTTFTNDSGETFDTTAISSPFREWFTAQMQAIREDGHWTSRSIVQLYRAVSDRLFAARSLLLEMFPGISEAALDEELCQKRLVLSLGGGGGTGYAHMSVFQILEEENLIPSFIAGTSLGSMMGYFRCLRRSYDPASAALRVPSWLTIARYMGIFKGGSRHGMPSLVNLEMDKVVSIFTQGMHEKEFPTFEELEIPFACVSTGILAGKAERELGVPSPGLYGMIKHIGMFPVHKIVETCRSVFQYFVDHPDLTYEVVFGLDPDTASMQATDAIGFSSMVPGVLHYEVPLNHYHSREVLDDLFEREHLWRMTDGGLVNNVPSSVAYRAVQMGKIQHRNVFVMAFDVFAPIPNHNAMFIPIQQLSVPNVTANMRYADCTCRLRYLFSPLNLSPSLSELHKLKRVTQSNIAKEIRLLRYAMTRLPSYRHFCSAGRRLVCGVE